jgi:hypothetical protein
MDTIISFTGGPWDGGYLDGLVAACWSGFSVNSTFNVPSDLKKALERANKFAEEVSKGTDLDLAISKLEMTKYQKHIYKVDQKTSENGTLVMKASYVGAE